MSNLFKTIYGFTVKDITGKDLPLSTYRGKVVLIVNTATRCGFASQLVQLQHLYEKYKERGFVVLAFPCNQFFHQEPGENEAIMCTLKDHFHVTFPTMSKIDVNGSHEDPLYTYLKSQQGGFFSNKIKWNFTKFLIDRNGIPVHRYSPSTTPLSFEKDIEQLLSKEVLCLFC